MDGIVCGAAFTTSISSLLVALSRAFVSLTMLIVLGPGTARIHIISRISNGSFANRGNSVMCLTSIGRGLTRGRCGADWLVLAHLYLQLVMRFKCVKYCETCTLGILAEIVELIIVGCCFSRVVLFTKPRFQASF
jgi:hypothetical protein